MGCNSSSEKFSLKPQQKQKIEDNAKLTVNQAEYYKTVATTVVPLVKSQMKMSELMRARAPLSSYFTSEPVPVQITDASRSMNDMLMDMQLSAFQSCKDIFAPDLAQMKNPGDRMKAESQVHSESDLHVATHTLQLLESIAKTDGSPTPARPQNTADDNKDTATGEATPVTNPAPAGAAGTSEVVLPNGKWDLAEGTAFYWSNEEQLFFHPPSGQFYDPHAQKWYDPDNDEWYDGDMD